MSVSSLTALGTADGQNRRVNQGLIEPLSERELEVLRLLGTDLTGPEIARELMVSLNTVRTHTKNIYSKLGVNNRRAAVRRAERTRFVLTNPQHTTWPWQVCRTTCRGFSLPHSIRRTTNHHINHHM